VTVGFRQFIPQGNNRNDRQQRHPANIKNDHYFVALSFPRTSRRLICRYGRYSTARGKARHEGIVALRDTAYPPTVFFDFGRRNV
jgi:hypothetical protein